ncbi:MAG: LacI family DNA-binding transcriptional regulator [Chloroflexota bacterium]|nr:LacI family DNA-binding transcriptional regulator [Chloroflexota bacterium]
MAVTIKDIAREVGRSVTTVSRALAGYEDVSPETRKRVIQAAQELGYEPNITARQLQKRRTDTLALIWPSTSLHFSDPFFCEFLSGIVDESIQQGFDLLVSTCTPSEDETERYLKYIRSRRVDGFIVVRTLRQDPRIDLLREQDYPFVAFGRVEGDNNFPFVDEDGEYGIRQVVNHLIELGHTRLACIAEPTRLTKANNRVQGFCSAMKAHGLAINGDCVVEGGFRQKSGHLISTQMLKRENPPTAIVAVNDLLALGAMSAAQERGLVIGEDVSITGFDDIILAEYVHPSLTTVHQPAHHFGTVVCQMLVKLIRGEVIEEKQIIIKPELIVRQSTGPVRR